MVLSDKFIHVHGKHEELLATHGISLSELLRRIEAIDGSCGA